MIHNKRSTDKSLLASNKNTRSKETNRQEISSQNDSTNPFVPKAERGMIHIDKLARESA